MLGPEQLEFFKGLTGSKLLIISIKVILLTTTIDAIWQSLKCKRGWPLISGLLLVTIGLVLELGVNDNDVDFSQWLIILGLLTISYSLTRRRNDDRLRPNRRSSDNPITKEYTAKPRLPTYHSSDNR